VKKCVAKCAGLLGVQLPPETGALNPMAIEVGFLSNEKHSFLGISLRAAGAPAPLPGGESSDNVSYASITRNFSTCLVFLLLTQQFLFVVIGPQNACGLNAPPR
jgi:hypothetical protein